MELHYRALWYRQTLEAKRLATLKVMAGNSRSAHRELQAAKRAVQRLQRLAVSRYGKTREPAYNNAQTVKTFTDSAKACGKPSSQLRGKFLLTLSRRSTCGWHLCSTGSLLDGSL